MKVNDVISKTNRIDWLCVGDQLKLNSNYNVSKMILIFSRDVQTVTVSTKYTQGIL